MKIRKLLVILLTLAFCSTLVAQDNAAKESYNAGIKAKQAKNFADAEKNFLAATTAYPQYKEAWNELGTVRWEMKKGAPAEEAFQKAIAIDPNFQQAYYNLGMVQLAAKKYLLATASLNKSLELKPGDADSQKGLGQAYLEQKNWDKAIEYYKLYNSANSSDSRSHFFLAQAYKEKADIPNAEKEYQEAVRIDPKFADGFFNYGNLLLAQKKFTAAISAYKGAVAADRGKAGAYYNLAVAYMNAQQWNEALQACQDFVRVAGNKPEFKGKVSQVKTEYIPKIEETINAAQ